MNIVGIDVGGTKILGVRADERGVVQETIKSQRWSSRGVRGCLLGSLG